MFPYRCNASRQLVWMSATIAGATALLMLCAGSRVDAWGPHSEITDAAIAALSSQDQARLVEVFGADEARRLRYLVWMGDFGNQFITWGGCCDGTPVKFYANDYLTEVPF
jgi:hypothetical protein